MSAAQANTRRHWFAPEVVQTSSMDCGPATLKCLLEGFGIRVNYGRLREACQTDVDGTSIDTMEEVAKQLGIEAEQIMIPEDHIWTGSSTNLPAIVVLRHPDGPNHFVVVWRRWGPWLQVMDPAIGRRWVRLKRFRQDIYRHELNVTAQDWRAWAGTPEFSQSLEGRMEKLGCTAQASRHLIKQALADSGWFTAGALDATIRLTQSLLEAKGVSRGKEAQALLELLFHQTSTSAQDIFTLVPVAYWSVIPDLRSADQSSQELKMRGAVLVKAAAPSAQPQEQGDQDPVKPLSPELQAALHEKTDNILRTVWRMLREDGLLGPMALIAAMALASGALMVEAFLFRSLFDLSEILVLQSQRLMAAAALIVFAAIVLLLEVPIVTETLRQGRHLETRLRAELLKKLPRLNDRYFQSRPISDMADRSHSIHIARNLPSMGLHLIQSVLMLALTFAGIMFLSPDSAVLASGIVICAIALPLMFQPALNERDLRVRNHAGALHGFYLDALLGIAPIRAHQAQANVRRQHENLLVEWARSSKGWIKICLLSDAIQSLIGLSLVSWMLIAHFSTTAFVTGSDLLLVYWTLKLPGLGARLSGLMHQYPSQRNVLLRLLEPLSAPQDVAPASHPTLPTPGALGFTMKGASVNVSGNQILHDIDLQVAAGEQIAIVGQSGAGKSALLGVLLGWTRLSEGELELDGTASSPDRIEQLRRQTAWVDPGIQIWNRSLIDNLNYTREDELLHGIGDAMNAANLRPVVEQLPEGLQTLLGEGGARLSGGEGQRVRLARALLTPAPRLALLDEPFRGMDRAQRRALLSQAREWWKRSTLLCVTHDIGETLSFDRVLVIEDGRIVEDGSPDALANSNTRYRALLQADGQLREGMWQSADWRQVHLRAGSLSQPGKTQ